MSQAGEIDVLGTHPEIATTFVANVGVAVPILNTIEILGSYVLAHLVPVQTVASGNTLTVDVQLANASASSNVNNAGLASFDSTDFNTDANGFVSLRPNRFQSINIQKFTSSGTYTPTAGMIYCTIECWAGGGGGGGADADPTGFSGAAGGGASGYSRTTASAATIGASQVVTIGTGGAGGAAGFNDGSAGTVTSVGTLCLSNPGGGGAAGGGGNNFIGGPGGTAGIGDITGTGQPGGTGIGTVTTSDFVGLSGFGGSTLVGGGGVAVLVAQDGLPGTGFGSGGSGGNGRPTGAQAGGNGAPGFAIITEYIG